MTMLKPHELAALALDAYQRGYYAGMPAVSPDDGLGSSDGKAVAGGTIIASSSRVLGFEVDKTADFFALAYLIEGEVIISFRGSDNLHFHTLPDGSSTWSGADAADVSDLWNGKIPDQLELALDFFNHVKTLQPEAEITTTGHSLGGALAGAVATLKNVEAVIFNNVAFEATSANIIRKVTSTQADFDAILAAKVFGGAVPIEPQFGQKSITRIAMAGDVAGYFRVGRSDVDDVQIDQPLGPIPAHIQGLLAIALLARDKYGATGDWVTSANAVFSALSDDYIAQGLGLSAANGNPASGVMKDKIASTILPGSDNPYGTQAALSLIDDMQDLGSAMAAMADQYWLTDLFVDRSVQFSALQAEHGVTTPRTGGVIIYDAVGQMVTIDQRASTWFIGDVQYEFGGDTLNFEALLADGVLTSSELAHLAYGPGKIEYVVQALGPNNWPWTVAIESEDATVEVRGKSTNDHIIGTDGSESFILGAGANAVKANGGVNWIYGGDEDDTLIDDYAWADFQVEFDIGSQAYFLVFRSSGSHPRIHIANKVDKFLLANQEFTAANIMNVAPEGIAIEAMGSDFSEHGLGRGTYVQGAVIGKLRPLDFNEHDRFTWEILGSNDQIYSIDEHGVIRTKTSIAYDYDLWRQHVGIDATFEDWQAAAYAPGYVSLQDTPYAITVRVKDAAGETSTGVFYLYFEDGGDTLFGTPGDDTLQGGVGRSVIAGLAGADRITDPDWLVLDYSASDAGITLNRSGSAQRSFSLSGGHAEGDTVLLSVVGKRLDVIGSEHDDTIYYAKQVLAGGGNDSIYYADYIEAGEGYDRVFASSNTLYVDFGTGGGELTLPRDVNPFFVDMEAGLFRRTDIYNVDHFITVLEDYGQLTGSNYSDTIYGTTRNDRIYSGGGRDIIYGGDGEDHIEGAGNLFGGNHDDTIVLTGGGGAWGGDGDDELTSSAQSSSLYGGEDQDTLTSFTYHVRMLGGEGADTFLGTLAQNSWNWISYEEATSGVGLDYDSYSGVGWLGEADGDVMTGNFSFYGSSYADTFNVTLRTGYGTEIRGGAGNDTMNVVLGSYTYLYGDGLEEVAGASYDDVITNTGNSGTIYGGRGNDTITGNGRIYGDEGADIIKGGSGNQTFSLGVDMDTDTFVYSGLSGRHTVYDFTDIDRIRIEGGQHDTFGDVMGAAEQVGNDAHLIFNDSAKIVLAGYALSSLMQSNFEFV